MKWYEKIGARLLQGVRSIKDERIRSVKEGDEKQIQNLLNSYSKKLTFARFWSFEELQFYMQSPIFRGKVLVEGDEIKAIVCAVVIPFIVKGKIVNIAIFENLHFENISFSDQKKLIRSLLYDLKKEDR